VNTTKNRKRARRLRKPQNRDGGGSFEKVLL